VICPCGADHSADAEGSRYFVSVRDAGRSGFPAGPYATHAEALADVEAVREIAYRLDGMTHFFEWGTARVDGDAAAKLGPGKLNEALKVSRERAEG